MRTYHNVEEEIAVYTEVCFKLFIANHRMKYYTWLYYECANVEKEDKKEIKTNNIKRINQTTNRIKVNKTLRDTRIFM